MGTFVKFVLLALLPLAIAEDCITGNNPNCRQGLNGVSPGEIKEIVDLHNKYRAMLANSQNIRGVLGPQRPAANMKALVWNDELASVAQQWVDQCNADPDKCRNNLNLNIHRSSAVYGSTKWSPVIDQWYKEAFNKLSKNKLYSQAVTGNYTRMISGTTGQIGCARATYGAYKAAQEHQPRDHRVKRQIISYGSWPQPEQVFFFPQPVSPYQEYQEPSETRQWPGYFGGLEFDPSGMEGAITHATKRARTATASPFESPQDENPDYEDSNEIPTGPIRQHLPKCPNIQNNKHYACKQSTSTDPENPNYIIVTQIIQYRVPASRKNSDRVTDRVMANNPPIPDAEFRFRENQFNPRRQHSTEIFSDNELPIYSAHHLQTERVAKNRPNVKTFGNQLAFRPVRSLQASLEQPRKDVETHHDLEDNNEILVCNYGYSENFLN